MKCEQRQASSQCIWCVKIGQRKCLTLQWVQCWNGLSTWQWRCCFAAVLGIHFCGGTQSNTSMHEVADTVLWTTRVTVLQSGGLLYIRLACLLSQSESFVSLHFLAVILCTIFFWFWAPYNTVYVPVVSAFTYIFFCTKPCWKVCFWHFKISSHFKFPVPFCR